MCIIPDLQDFNNTVITITFDPDEEERDSERAVTVAIVDDDINEAIEQVFVLQLALINSVNPGGVDLTSRSSSLFRIIDDDRKLFMLLLFIIIVLTMS